MPTRSFLADLESGLPLESGSRSSSTAGCADLSWSALRCTLSIAEEAARQLHLCVAWVNEESQKDFDSWNAAKKDDDLFGPLRPASRQHNVDPTVAAYAAAPAVHADFSRTQLINLPDAQHWPEPFEPSGLHRHPTLADAEGSTSASSPLWEDFKCSPTQPQHSAMAKQAQQAASPANVVKGSHYWRQGAEGSLYKQRLPGLLSSCSVMASIHAGCYTYAFFCLQVSLMQMWRPNHGVRQIKQVSALKGGLST